MGAEVPAATANNQSAGAAAAADSQGGPPLAESDSDSEDQLPTAADGSLLVSEPPQPLYVVTLRNVLIDFVCRDAEYIENIQSDIIDRVGLCIVRHTKDKT